MKIKTKKQLNLPKLIDWAWENDVKNVTFRGLDKKGYVVSININDKGQFTSDWRISKNDLFTVEVEKEIDEDTVIPKMLVVGRFDGYEEVYNQKLSSFNQHLLSAYLIHDDGFMELIYDEEKGLVE